MEIAAAVAVCLVAVLHVYIMILEMFLWKRPHGRRTFGLTPDFADSTAALAANQGLYNGFLAAGLFWGLSQGAAGFQIKVFFLSCLIIAGIFGAATAHRRILFVQAVPALIALALVWLARG